MDSRILSIDLGTSGIKCSVFPPEGNIIASTGADYPTWYGDAGEAEQNPSDWYAALVSCCRNLEAEHPGLPASLSALAISGQMMGAVCVSAELEHIGPALIHADVRAESDGDIFPWQSRGDDFERVYQLSGHRPSPAYSGAKIAWLRRHDSPRYEKTRWVLNPKDFLNMKLTGEVYTDVSDASGTLLYNLKTRKWDGELADALGVDLSVMPPILASHSLAGTVTAAASRETGLPAGLPVAVGAGDGICAGIGAGSVKPGIAYNYIGTTAWVATTSTEPLIDPSFRVFTFAHAVEGLYHPMGTMQSAGAAVKWLRDQLFSNYQSDDIAYRAMDKAMAESVPGSNGVLFLPYLNGERSPWWKSDMRAAWTGLSHNTTFADQVRSVYEGVSNNLAMIAEILSSLSPFDELSLLGGGGLSQVWPQILADAYAKPVKIHADTVSVTARGAAVIAAVATGIYDSYDAAMDLVKTEKELVPEAAGVRAMQAARQDLAETIGRLYFGG